MFMIPLTEFRSSISSARSAGIVRLLGKTPPRNEEITKAHEILNSAPADVSAYEVAEYFQRRRFGE